jgi:hypothetical protein
MVTAGESSSVDLFRAFFPELVAAFSGGPGSSAAGSFVSA